MADQQHEYRIEPTFLSPTELRNEQYKLEDLLNELAAEGWVYDDAVVVDPSSMVFHLPTIGRFLIARGDRRSDGLRWTGVRTPTPTRCRPIDPRCAG